MLRCVAALAIAPSETRHSRLSPEATLQRYTGQDLPTNPHIAVLFADKIGGFVIATPLLRGLKARHPGAILDYYGGDLTAELEESCPHIDSRVSLFGPADAIRRAADYSAARQALHCPYDLAVNLDSHPVNAVVTSLLAPKWVVGRTYTPDGRGMLPFLTDDPVDPLHEEDWSAPDLLVRYAGVLKSRFIGEIFCRLARVETDFTRTDIASAPSGLERVPDVLVATGGTRSAKLWPSGYWVELAHLLDRRGLTVGLLGGSPAKQRAHYGSAETDDVLIGSTRTIDLRGKLRFPQVAGALKAATACITIDNGIMHLAYSVGTPTAAIFGASPWQLWAPELAHLSVVLPPDACTLCAENRFRNDACLRERHACMESITPRLVLHRLDALLSARAR